MGIVTGQFSRPAKFSTIIADADLDIGARAILTTNLSILEIAAGWWGLQNRAKTVYTGFQGLEGYFSDKLRVDIINEVTGAGGVTVDGLLIKDDKITEVDGIAGVTMPKIVSDNLRNSHDAEDTETSTGASYVKVKTMTFTNGVKGTVRAKMDIKSNNASYNVSWVLYKNGVLIGTADDTTTSTTYVTKSEDVDVGTVAAGETLEAWVKAEHGSAAITFENFRLYYDDDSGTSVMVTS